MKWLDRAMMNDDPMKALLSEMNDHAERQR
jgi:hypothetical protein